MKNIYEKIACLAGKGKENSEYKVKYNVGGAELKLISSLKKSEFLEFKFNGF